MESQQYCTVPATQCCMRTFVSSVNSLRQFDCLEAGKETFLILPVRMFVEKKMSIYIYNENSHLRIPQ